MSFTTDTRAALAGPLLLFLASIVLAMMLYATVQPVGMDMSDRALEMADTTSAATGLGYISTVWTNLHYLVIGLGALQFLAAAVYRGRVGR